MIRSCTTYGSASAVFDGASQSASSTSQPSDDPLAAVVVVRLEHETVAMLDDERDQIDLAGRGTSSAAPRRARVHGMWASIASRCSLGEERRVALVAQHGQARLLVQDLALERIHHADRAIAHRSQDRAVHLPPGSRAR